MSEFTPSQKSVQKVARKITTAADVAGARVMNLDDAGEFQAGVFFTQEQWAKFIVLLLEDAFKP